MAEPALTSGNAAIDDLVGWLRQQINANERWVFAILDELGRLPHYAWDGRDEYGCPKHTDPEVWRAVFGGDAVQVCDCGRDAHVELMLRLLALRYADRSGYRREWVP